MMIFPSPCPKQNVFSFQVRMYDIVTIYQIQGFCHFYYESLQLIYILSHPMHQFLVKDLRIMGEVLCKLFRH